jgi:hypothetical protein
VGLSLVETDLASLRSSLGYPVADRHPITRIEILFRLPLRSVGYPAIGVGGKLPNYPANGTVVAESAHVGTIDSKVPGYRIFKTDFYKKYGLYCNLCGAQWDVAHAAGGL